MSIRQVCEEFGFSQSFLYHLPSPLLPRYQVGKKILYLRDEVVAAIREHRLAAPPPTKKAVAKSGKRGRPRNPTIEHDKKEAAPAVSA